MRKFQTTDWAVLCIAMLLLGGLIAAKYSPYKAEQPTGNKWHGTSLIEPYTDSNSITIKTVFPCHY